MSDNVLEDIERLVQYHKLLGITHYPNSAEIQEFLQFELQEIKPELGVSTAEKVPKTRKSVEPQYHDERQISRNSISPKNLAKVATTEAVEERIATHISSENCKSCKLYSPDAGFYLGKGGKNLANVRLLVVGDWLKTNVTLSGEAAFGAEEDIMLSKMFVAMKLPPEQVFVTNIIKCKQKPGLRLSPDDANQCRAYLLQQIKDIRPEIICAMGSFAAKTILGKSQSLSQLRGKFYQIDFFESCTIPVMATYHPSFLLNNNEMKKPTWFDLQKIINRLYGVKK